MLVAALDTLLHLRVDHNLVASCWDLDNLVEHNPAVDLLAEHIPAHHSYLVAPCRGFDSLVDHTPAVADHIHLVAAC